jgi:two-component system cell cycle response regulator CtrA
MSKAAIPDEASTAVGSSSVPDCPSIIQTADLVVDLNTRVASVDGKPVRLTSKEYGILELLSLRKGATVTKEMFLTHLYDGVHEPQIKIIDVFVCMLRKKLAQATGGNHYIETIWGRGYVLRDPAPPLTRAKKSRSFSARRTCAAAPVRGRLM